MPVTAVILVLFYRLIHVHADFLAPTPEAATGVFRANPAVALTLYLLLYIVAQMREQFASADARLLPELHR